MVPGLSSRRRVLRSLGALAAIGTQGEALRELGLSSATVQAIESGNARRLIPRL
jgi:hypothetical protein